MKSHGFNLRLVYNGEEVRCTGSITPSYPDVMHMPNGDPGYPGCGPEIDDLRLFQTVNGQEIEVEEMPDAILDALFDDILEAVDDDGQDPDERYDAEKNGD